MALAKLSDELKMELASYNLRYGDTLDRMAAELECAKAEALGILTTHSFLGLGAMDSDTADVIRFCAGRALSTLTGATIPLPLDPAMPRSWQVYIGDDEGNGDGWTLTLELLSRDEADAVADALVKTLGEKEQ